MQSDVLPGSRMKPSALKDKSSAAATPNAAHSGTDSVAAVLDALRESLLILNEDLSVRFANRAYYSTFHADASHTIDRGFYTLNDGVWDNPRLRRLVQGVLDKDVSFDDFEIEIALPKLGRR